MRRYLLIAPEGIEILLFFQDANLLNKLLIAPEGIEISLFAQPFYTTPTLLIAPEGIEIFSKTLIQLQAPPLNRTRRN